MPPVLSDFDASSFVGSLAPVGIVIALIGAVFLSLGAQFQHRGVEQVEASHGSGAKAGLSPGQLFRLLARPWWALGTLMLGLAIRRDRLHVQFPLSGGSCSQGPPRSCCWFAV